MLKQMRDTTHYSGRDYDQLIAQIDRLESKQQAMKRNLITSLTEALKGQDEKTIQNVFSVVNQAIN